MAHIKQKREKDSVELDRVNYEKRQQIKNIVERARRYKRNWPLRLWKYYSTYEKIWLISICTVGILLAILFPEDPMSPTWLRVIEVISIIGACSCELLLSKQSKWAFIVSFVLYDVAQTIIYYVNGYYVSALFEIIFWFPVLFICFAIWDKRKDKEETVLTQVKKVNYKKELGIFIIVLAASVGVGALFTGIGFIAAGLSDYWYLDSIANTFSVCNGIFLILRYREQWLAWLGTAIAEAIMWCLSGQFIMLVMSLGYLMNSTYGFIKWTLYIKKHKKEEKVLKAPAVQEA